MWNIWHLSFFFKLHIQTLNLDPNYWLKYESKFSKFKNTLKYINLSDSIFNEIYFTTMSQVIAEKIQVIS